MLGAQKHQARRQDRTGDIHIVSPGFLLLLPVRAGEIWKTAHGIGFLLSLRMRVEVHRQIDI